jgi:hypothetical protein
MGKDPNSHLRRAKTTRQSTPDEVRANHEARANNPKPGKSTAALRQEQAAKREALRQRRRLNKAIVAETSTSTQQPRRKRKRKRKSFQAELSGGDAVKRALTPLEKKALKAEYKERARIREAAEQYEATRKHFPKRKKKVWVTSIVSSGFETNRKKH